VSVERLEMSSPAVPSPRPLGLLDRLSERQMLLLVMLFGVLLYIPFAGSYGLWDPWETHYGEVARQMTARHDYISLWWPGSPIDGEAFWSKPVLTFWLMSLAMHIAGIGGAGAPSGEMAVSSAAEWALRVPFCLMALPALVGIYLPTARFVSRRAGVLAVLALGTFPLFSLVARQAMTDMAFIGPMTLALGLGALALFDDDDAELPRRRWWRLSWPHHPLFYAAIALITLTAVPQFVIDSLDLTWRLFPNRPKSRELPGILVMLPYIAGFLAFLYWSARTRFKAPLYLYIAGVLCALATLAKGIAGLGLPVIVFLAYLAFTWNWKRLARAQLFYGVLVALLACAVVAVPWHHAMLVRHGLPFWNELYGDNHWRRMVLGRHGDRGSFEYFLRELGYGVFPWVAIAPAALAWAAMRPFRGVEPGAPGGRRQEILWFGAIWFVSAYTIVSMSMTKFHHYILPALPGLAIVVGCFLDDLLAQRRGRLAKVAALVGLPLLALVTYDLAAEQRNAQHFIWLFSYDYINAPQGRPWPPELSYAPVLITVAALFGVGGLLLAWRRVQLKATAALSVVAVLFTYFLLDVYMKQVSDRWSQKPLIAKYYATRSSPDERLIAWQMYWRGETFYTANEIFQGPMDKRTVFLGDRNAENLKAYLGRNKGKRLFFIVERARWSTLQSLLPDYARPSLHIIDERNNKFYLAEARL
jgi:4-amino-4-deoxy-L-arabinose transferase-like glycosyltransferase